MTDGRTDNTFENNEYYRPWLWVGQVDQFHDSNALQMKKDRTTIDRTVEKLTEPQMMRKQDSNNNQ